MSIEKKSLISTLKTTKKANVASAPAPAKDLNSAKGLTPARGLTPSRGLTTTKGFAKSKGLTKR